MTIAESPTTVAPLSRRRQRRSIADLLAPLEQIAANSPNLVANHDARFELNGVNYELPRYLFVGPRGGDTPIRIGIFAGIHGDEPEGVHAIVDYNKCNKCGVCNRSCFYDAISLTRVGSVVDPKKCDGCGLCKEVCPENAISMCSPRAVAAGV